MAFRLKRKESLEGGIKRVLLEQISKAEDELAAASGDLHEAIHQARKRCKRIRALYRLVRPAVPEVYAAENRRFRDAARELSAARDAEAMIEAYDGLMARFEDAIERRKDFSHIRRLFTLRRNALVEEGMKPEEQVESFREQLRLGRRALDDWSLSDSLDTVQEGLLKTYRRGRKSMRRCAKGPDDGELHDWRKRAKYLRFQLKFLRNVWPNVVETLESEAAEIADLLGEDHDLAVMAEFLAEERDVYGAKADLNRYTEFLNTRRQELQRGARALGVRLFQAKPKKINRCLSAYWEVWRR